MKLTLFLRHSNYIAKSFTNEIASLLQHADLAISRAGASALSELAACGTPAILVPYPLAKDQHQDFNAAVAAELGAAVIVHQHEPKHNTLRATLSRLLKSRLSGDDQCFDPLFPMKLGMNQLAVRGAEKVLVDIIEGFS